MVGIYLCRWTVLNPITKHYQKVDIVCPRLPIDVLLQDMHIIKRVYREMKLSQTKIEDAVKSYNPKKVQDIFFYENKLLGNSMAETIITQKNKNYVPGCWVWNELVNVEMRKEYMTNLIEKIKNERNSGKEIFPEPNMVFNAFNLTQFAHTHVVILGQDPYHTLGAAHGLAFSCLTTIPPSLNNIYKEIFEDIYRERNDQFHDIFNGGNLTFWAKQGVLLLNTVLTVERGKPHSHANYGWENFIHAVIDKLNTSRPKVFLLWGKHAAGFEDKIDKSVHLVLKAAHPSPYSADKGFFGCKHFSKTNSFLKEHYGKIIIWGNAPQLQQTYA